MKKFLLAVMGLMLATQLIACQNNDNDNGSSGGTTATTPLDQGCLYGSTNCNSAIYNQYSQYGWRAYPVNFNQYGGYYNYYQSYYYPYYGQRYYGQFCDCPAGFIPTYNGAWGVGCVRSNYVPNNGFYFQISVNSHSINIPQVTNTQPWTSSYNRCQSLTQACDVTLANSCGSGQVCVATAGGSRLGICVRQ